MEKIGLEAILKMGNFTSGMRQYTQGIQQIEDNTSSAANEFGLLGSAMAGIGAAVGVATAAAYALAKAFEFGKEGAVIAQTRESFDRLMASMGVGPGILQKLRDASLGTVDDMTIMSSTMTLLAGTSDELGRSIIEAAPKLMEIAKAAHKLNPSLGETSFLYQSLATGIKRSSPLILDNLGLVIKVGEANEQWAAKMGTTVEAMTAEQKSMALLEAALEAGDRMIEQVGGSTEEMGDAFAQAEVQIKNATDTLKEKAAPVVAEVVGFLADMVDGMDKTAEAAESIRKSADSYDVYLNKVLEAAEANHQLSASDVEVIKRQAEVGEEFHRTVGAMGILTEAQYNAAKETDRVSERWQNYANALKAEAQPATVDLVAALGDAAMTTDEFKASLDLLHAAIKGAFGDAAEKYRSKLAELDQQFAASEISASEYAAAIQEQTAAFQENTNALIYNIAEKQILDALEKGLIEDVNASGTAYDEATTALWTMAEQMGLVDAATLTLMEATQEATNAFINGKVQAGELGGNLSALAGAAVESAGNISTLRANINQLQSKTITITTNYVSQGLHEAGTEVGPLQGGRQHGGVVQAGMSYLVGEAGPEMFIPERPGTILPHELTMALPALLGMAGGAGTTPAPTVSITMNPTINNGMDLAQFELLTERTVQRAIRGI